MGTISFSYNEICSVSVVQPFYRNLLTRQTLPQATPDIRFVATNDCTELMKRLELSIKQDDSTAGFFLFGRTTGQTTQGENLLRFTPRDSDILRFWMVVDNADILNFDSFPVHLPEDQLLLLTNDRVISPPETELHLTSNASGITNDSTSDDYDWVTTSGSTYRYTHPTQLSADGIYVKHLATDIKLAPYSLINQSGKAYVIFDLSSLPLGSCELVINGNSTLTFYYIGDVVPRGTIGIVELLLSSTIDSEYRIIKTGNTVPAVSPAFVIRLQNRPTLWRYTFHLESNSPLSIELAGLDDATKAQFLDHLNVTSNDPSITFLLSSASENDLIFSSTAAIALQEQYRVSTSASDLLQLSLRKNIDPATQQPGDIIRTDLPYPSTSLLSTEHDANSNTDFIYSDIFLTL